MINSGNLLKIAEGLLKDKVPSEAEIITQDATNHAGSAFSLDIADFEFIDQPTVIGFSGSEEVQAPYSFEVEIATKTYIDLSILIKKHTAITYWHDALPRRFSGYIAEIENTYFDNNTSTYGYHITLRPLLWFLTYETRFFAYHNKSILEITTDIFARWGITHASFHITAPVALKAKEYRVQYDESTYNFLHRLWNEAGIVYYFTFNGEHEELHFVDGQNIPHDIEIPIPYARKGTPHPATNHVFDFTAKQSVAHNAHVVIFEGREDFAQQNALAMMEQPNFLSTTYPSDGDSLATSTNVLNQHVTKSKLKRTTFFAKSTHTHLNSGAFVVINNHRDHMVEESFYITKITHQVSNDGDTPFYYNTLTLKQLDDHQFFPETTASKPLIHGLQQGVVIGDDPAQPHCDALGRIQVKFTWDIENSFTIWVPVSQSLAGDNWGCQFIPRPQMEVLITYINGNPDYPLVVGTLYNHAHKPAYEPHHSPLISGFISKSTNGVTTNKLLFQDEENQEEIRLEAGKNMCILVENDYRTHIEKGDETHHIKQGSLTYTLEDGTFTRRVDQEQHTTTISKDGRQDTLNGPWQTHIKQGDKQTVLEQGNLKLELHKGDAAIHITGNGTLKVSGTITIESEHAIQVKANTINAETKLLKAHADTTEIHSKITTLTSTSTTVSGESIQLNASTKIGLDAPLVESAALDMKYKLKGE